MHEHESRHSFECAPGLITDVHALLSTLSNAHRARQWGPMAMLTYWSLRAYDHVPLVRAARKALCSQMAQMMLNMWRRHRHICENFNPHRNATDCSGTKFYHWGALAGMISMLEAGDD